MSRTDRNSQNLYNQIDLLQALSTQDVDQLSSNNMPGPNQSPTQDVAQQAQNQSQKQIFPQKSMLNPLQMQGLAKIIASGNIGQQMGSNLGQPNEQISQAMAQMLSSSGLFSNHKNSVTMENSGGIFKAQNTIPNQNHINLSNNLNLVKFIQNQNNITNSMHDQISKKPDLLATILQILANAQHVRGQPKTMAQMNVGTRRTFEDTTMTGHGGQEAPQSQSMSSGHHQSLHQHNDFSARNEMESCKNCKFCPVHNHHKRLKVDSDEHAQLGQNLYEKEAKQNPMAYAATGLQFKEPQTNQETRIMNHQINQEKHGNTNSTIKIQNDPNIFKNQFLNNQFNKQNQTIADLMSNSKPILPEQKSSNARVEAPNPQIELQESTENEQINTLLSLGKCSKEKLLQNIKTWCRGPSSRDNAINTLQASIGQNATSPKYCQQIFTSNPPFNFVQNQNNQANSNSAESPSRNSDPMMRAVNKLQPQLNILGKFIPSAATIQDPAKGALTKNQIKIQNKQQLKNPQLMLPTSGPMNKNQIKTSNASSSVSSNYASLNNKAKANLQNLLVNFIRNNNRQAQPFAMRQSDGQLHSPSESGIEPQAPNQSSSQPSTRNAPNTSQINRLQGAQKGTTYCQSNQLVKEASQRVQDTLGLGSLFQQENQRLEDKVQDQEDTVTEQTDNQGRNQDSEDIESEVALKLENKYGNHNPVTEASTSHMTSPEARDRAVKIKSHFNLVEAPVEAGEDQIAKLEYQDQFKCNQCDELFRSAQSLGGHISRKHPKSSAQYQRKMERRQERTFDRKLLELAKEKHFRLYGASADLNRVKIRRFKKELRRQFEGGKLKINGFKP